MTGRSRARDRSRPSGEAVLLPPQQISGLVAWLDAAAGASGSPVDTWSGRVGPVCTQGTVANRPAAPAADSALGGQLALTMDATDRLIASSATNISSAYTLVLVQSIATDKNENGIFRLAPAEASGSGGLCLYVTSIGHLVIASADTSWYKIAYNSMAATTGYAVIVTCDGTEPGITLEVGTISGSTITWSPRVLTAITGTFAMPASTGLYLVPGGGWSSGASFLNGKLSQQIVYNRVFSAADTTLMKAYLKSRFAP